MLKRERGKERSRSVPALTVVVLLAIAVLATPPVLYAYDAPGKKEERADPFKPFLRSGHDQSDRVRPLTPLEMYNIEDLQLLGVAVSGKKRMAMIRDPEGKFHTLSVGMWIGPNDGRVVAISGSQVIIEEILMGPLGKKQKNRVVLDLYIENTGGEKP